MILDWVVMAQYKKLWFDLCPWFLAHIYKNPWNLLRDKNVFCMLMRWLLVENPRELLDGIGHQKDKTVIRELEISALLSSTPYLYEDQGAEDWNHSPVAKDLINHAYIMKPPYKLLNNGVWELLCWLHIELLGGWCSWRGHRSSVPPPAPYLG